MTVRPVKCIRLGVSVLYLERVSRRVVWIPTTYSLVKKRRETIDLFNWI